MKKIFLMLGVVFVFTLTFTGCPNEPDPYGTPRLNNIYLITKADQPNFDRDFSNNRTSFSVSEGSAGVGFGVIGENFSPYSLARYFVSFKKGGSIIDEREYPMPMNVPGASERDSSGRYDYFWFWLYNTGSTIIQIANDYSFEVYVVDTEGNRSNTLTKNFAITAD